MKKYFLICFILIGLIFTGCEDKSIDSSVMVDPSKQKDAFKFVPQEFTLVKSDGTAMPLKSTENGLNFEEYYGKKAVLIDVFATWCPPCIKEMPVLKELREKYKNDFEIVSVLFEKDKSHEEIIAFIKEHQLEYPMTIGEENFKLTKELGDVKKIPEKFLFTKDGRFIKKFVGETPKDELEQYINLAIGN